MNVLMKLSRILITELSDQQMIFLKEEHGDRSFPIMIGTNEAMAIDRRLKQLPLPRPLTHELLASVMEALGGDLESILINALQEHTFIATLYINQDGNILKVDSRPSDAIALGVAFNTPIYVNEDVLNSVLDQSSTRDERIEMLRRRMAILDDRISELSANIQDESFQSQAPEEVISDALRQLDEMQAERDAIERVLDKLA